MQSRAYKIAFAICLTSLTFWFFNHQNKPTQKLSDLPNQVEEHGEERENPIERMENEFNMLKNPMTGTIPRGIHQQVVKAAQKASTFQLTKQANQKNIPMITVTSRGPNNLGGRTRALGFDVRNSDIVLAGGVSSGIFRSTDNGANWTRVTPAGMLHNLTTIAQDPRSGQEDTWYAGTGEKIGNSADGEGAAYNGYGIWKSTDNGLTWSVLASTQMDNEQHEFDSDFDFISKIIVNPNNGHVLAIAGEVIKRSTDGGMNWTDELGDSDANEGQPGDIVYNANSSKFYAAIHGGSTAGGAGIWSSTDGDTWMQERTPVQLNTNGVGRIIIANVANTAGIVAMYQLSMPHTCTSGGTSEAGLQHFDGASTWADHTDKISNCAGGTASPKNISLQGAYNMCLTTKPNDANLVYLGGVEIYRYNLSTNAYEFIGGSQLPPTDDNLHVDNHILMFEDDNILWAGNDGGLRNTDATGTIMTGNEATNGYDWDSKVTDYVTYQYYDGDIASNTGSMFVGGAAQDNAFTVQPTTAEAREIGPTVDGTAIGIISGTSFTTYSVIAAFQNGGITRLVNGMETDIQPDGKKQGFHTKLHLDDDNRNILYYQHIDEENNDFGLLRTRVASTVDFDITDDAATGWEDLSGVSDEISGGVSAMATSRNVQYSGAYTASDANRKLYFGTEDGKVYRLNNPAFGGEDTAPTSITPTGAMGHVSDIAVNPMDDKEILVTYSNYGVPSVWHTSDASVATPTWTNVEGPATGVVALCSARSASIVNVPNVPTVYLVGTSAGLYATETLSGATTTWEGIEVESGGTLGKIGLAVCSDMRHRTTDNKMVLSTHGNGLFFLEFPTGALAVELTTFDGKATQAGNLLSWTTSSETNNKGFDIEQSLDGETFEKIGFMTGKETSTQTQYYQFLDKNAETGLTYYRLKSVDEHDSFKYSATISILRGDDKPTQISLYPNPVVRQLTIENGVGFATIYSVSGQKLMEFNISSSSEQIDVSDLPKGNYALSILQQNGEIWTEQFVK